MALQSLGLRSLHCCGGLSEATCWRVFRGGFGPGVLATIVSGLLAWYLFLPPAFEFALTWPQGASILTFILISLLLVGLVTGLNSIVNRFLMLEQNFEFEIERCRYAERDARRLAAIVESSDDAIVAKDLNGIITSWNQGAERLFGYTADEMVGKPISILIPPDRINEEPSIPNACGEGNASITTRWCANTRTGV